VIVKTTWIYPGWFAGVMAQAAKVSTIFRFVETADHSKVLLEIHSTKAPGNIQFVGIPNNNDRMSEGYAKTGKTLAALINKKLNEAISASRLVTFGPVACLCSFYCRNLMRIFTRSYP